MGEKLFKKYIGDTRWDLHHRNSPFECYKNGYLEALCDLENLDRSDAFKTAFPTLADQEKYFDVFYWIAQQMRGIAFDPEEAFSAESQKRGEDLPCKDLRVIASGKLGDPRDFEWVEEKTLTTEE